MDAFWGLAQALVAIAGYVFLLRFLLQLSQADFYNPISQGVVKASDPLCRPLRHFLPARGRLDIASLLLAVIVHLAFWAIVTSLQPNGIPWAAVLARTGFDVVRLILNIYFAALIILIILSWIIMANPAIAQKPLWPVVNQLINPLAEPLRRVIPPLGGLDLSVLVLFLGIQFAKTLNAKFWFAWLS